MSKKSHLIVKCLAFAALLSSSSSWAITCSEARDFIDDTNNKVESYLKGSFINADQSIAKKMEIHRLALEQYVNQLRNEKTKSDVLCTKLLGNIKTSMKAIDDLGKDLAIK